MDTVIELHRQVRECEATEVRLMDALDAFPYPSDAEWNNDVAERYEEHLQQLAAIREQLSLRTDDRDAALDEELRCAGRT